MPRSRPLGHKSIEVTHQIYGHLVPTSWDRARTVLDDAYRAGRRPPPRKPRAESVLTPGPPAGHLPADTALRSTMMQIFEGTNQIQRLVISRDLARG
ncbi:MAG TPA: hypothetical protein VI365_30280 [Trebonia sp.]